MSSVIVLLYVVFFFLKNLLGYYKGVQLRKSQMEEMHRARCGGRAAELPCPPQAPQPSEHTLMCSSTWRLGGYFSAGCWGFRCGTPMNGSHTVSLHPLAKYLSTATKFSFWNWGGLSQNKWHFKKIPKPLSLGLGPVCLCLCVSEREKMPFSSVQTALSKTTTLKHDAW